MRAILQVIVLFLSLALPQGNVVRIGNNGTPAGTAPALQTSMNNCSTGTFICNGIAGFSATAGDTIFVIASYTPTATMLVADAALDSFTRGSVHTLATNSTTVCSTVTAGQTNGSFSCTASLNTDWVSCQFFSVHCGASCVIEKGPTYADTSGTGGSATMTAGSITTTAQLNELIIGGFTTNCTSCGATGRYAAISPYTLPGAPCDSGTNCGENNGTSTGGTVAMEYNNVTVLGTYTATITEPTSKNTVGFTMAIR